MISGGSPAAFCAQLWDLILPIPFNLFVALVNSEPVCTSKSTDILPSALHSSLWFPTMSEHIPRHYWETPSGVSR